MKDLFLQILVLAYAAVGIVSIIAYLPTIKDLLDKKPSANKRSYIIWTVTTAVTFLYSLFVLDDFLFRAVSAVNFIACFIILILLLRFRN